MSTGNGGSNEEASTNIQTLTSCDATVVLRTTLSQQQKLQSQSRALRLIDTTTATVITIPDPYELDNGGLPECDQN